MDNDNNNDNGLLSILTREGVLIKVSVSYWRGHKKLRPEDIGLGRKNVSDRLISLGHKRLLPKDCLQELALIEGRAHALVETNTFPFLNDRVMEQQLENVKKELLSKTAEEYRDSAVARARLKNGLSQLANQARTLAHQDATELVNRFGELGRRKFNLAA